MQPPQFTQRTSFSQACPPLTISTSHTPPPTSLSHPHYPNLPTPPHPPLHPPPPTSPLPTLILPSGFLNLFAAIFAAASLGYLTPAEPFCRPVTDRELRPEWSGNNWFFAVQCQLRVYPSRQTELQLLNKEMSELANELGKDGQTIQQAIARITALERRMEDIKLAPSSGGSSLQR